jgi:hypothetical protein
MNRLGIAILALLLALPSSDCTARGDEAAETTPPQAVPWGGADFIQYYVTARLVHDGLNPYDLEAAGRLQQELGRPGAPLETYGPPTCLLPYVGLGRLSFAQAVAVHLTLSVLLLAGCAWAWVRWLVRPRAPFLLLCCLALVPLWPPTLFVLGMGQNTVLVLAGLTGCVAALRKGWDMTAGVCLAAVTVKPHLAVALVAFVAAWTPGLRRYRLLAGLVAALLTAAAAMMLIRPSIWGDYIAFLRGVTPPSQYHGATLDGFGRLYLGHWFGLVSWSLWLVSVVAAAALGWADRGGEGRPWRAALAACVALAGVPHAFSYDFVLLLPVFLGVVGRVLAGERARWAWRCVPLAVAIGVLLAGKKLGWPEFVYWPVPWLALLAAARAPAGQRAAAAKPL